MRRRLGRWRVGLWVVGTGVLVLGAYLCFFHRWRVAVERDGWVVQYTYLMFKCPHCCGRIERLECNGRPLPVLDFPGADRGAYVMKLATPVGSFVLPAGDRWRIYHHDDRRAESLAEPITAEELKQGWYDTGPNRIGTSETPPRKSRTPEHWCWARGLDRCCWVDPRVLNRVDWNRKGGGETTSKPAGE